MKKRTMGTLILLAMTFFAIESQAQTQEEQAPPSEKPPHKERLTPKEAITKMDADKDGKISKEEAKGPLQKHFVRVDMNEDGFLTEEELQKARERKRKREENAPQPKG